MGLFEFRSIIRGSLDVKLRGHSALYETALGVAYYRMPARTRMHAAIKPLLTGRAGRAGPCKRSSTISPQTERGSVGAEFGAH